MLAGIYYGAQYGGSTTAILVNLPGESSSVVTAIDGYQMARQGHAGKALATAALGSFFAGSVATVVVACFAPPLADLALEFGPADYFSLMVLGLVAAVVLASGSLLNAVGMVIVGLLLGLIGTDVNSGQQRYTYDLPELADGISFVIVAMGMFGIGEIVRNLEHDEERHLLMKKVKGLMLDKADFKRILAPVLRGTLLGSALGILPGGGAMLASFASYSIEKKVSPNAKEFGKGAIEGVAAPEAANNAGAQTSFIPMLTLGIPSNPVMAGHHAGTGRDDGKTGPVLGLDRLHVVRQPVPGRAELADDRAVGEDDHGALPPPVPGHPAVLRDRGVQPE
jgi:TctA family transporter